MDHKYIGERSSNIEITGKHINPISYDHFGKARNPEMN